MQKGQARKGQDQVFNDNKRGAGNELRQEKKERLSSLACKLYKGTLEPHPICQTSEYLAIKQRTPQSQLSGACESL